MTAADALVVIPMYDSVATVGAAVRCALNQTNGCVRVVVVDDGSTDAGADAARDAAQGDPRFELVHQPNAGLSAARNAGFDRRSGEPYVLFLDADDELLPDAVETLLGLAATCDANEIPCASAEVVDPVGRFVAHRSPDSDRLDLRDMLQMSLVLTHCQAFPAAIFKRFRYDERVRLVEDYDLYHRMAIAGVRWRCIDQAVGRYRVGAGSMSADCGRMLDATAALVERSVHAARHGRLLDWTASDDETAHAGLALTFASRLAARGDRAAAMCMIESRLAGRPPAARVSPTLAARAGADAMVFGLAIAPNRSSSRHDAARDQLQSFWRLLADRLGLPATFADETQQTIDAAAEPPARLAAAMIDTATKLVHASAIPRAQHDRLKRDADHGGRRADAGTDHAARPIVVGYGKNGRRVVAEAVRCGLRIELRDERFDRGRLERPDSDLVRVAPHDAAIDEDAVILLTMSDDADLFERLVDAGVTRDRIVRWRDASPSEPFFRADDFAHVSSLRDSEVADA